MDNRLARTSAFGLNIRPRAGLPQRLMPAIRGPLERLLRLSQLDQGYREMVEQESNAHFIDRALAWLNVTYDLSSPARVPTSGRCVVIANHPFGAVEGLVLASLLRSFRPDVKVMANSRLGRIPELSDLLILVDPLGNDGSAQSNLRPLKAAITWLKRNGMLVVFPAGEVAHARLSRREIAFRQVGEGTGRAIDLDGFDPYYTPLCLWNTRRDDLAGAYRLGRVDEILRKQGIGGLYTRTLFDYDRQLLERLGPALELGRSFVKAEYQRTPMPLFLLWKGIGQYVLRFPQ